MTTRINGHEVVRYQLPSDASKGNGYRLDPHTHVKEEKFHNRTMGALDVLLATEPGSEEAATAVENIQTKRSIFKNTRDA